MGAERCDVVVVGAGLAGLACAARLTRWGFHAEVLEAGDAVGGRVRTDLVDGFRIDRGFQLLNTAYPEARTVLDLDALELRRLDSAVAVHRAGRLHRVPNPLRAPAELLTAVTSSAAGTRSKLALVRYALGVTARSPSRVRSRPDLPARQAWREAGLPDDVVDRLLVPFLAGVTLDPDVDTSRRFVDLVMRGFALGRSAVPAGGMQRIPDQLASALPPDRVRLETRVDAVSRRSVLVDGAELPGRAVVVAVDPWTAHTLLPALGEPPAARGVTTFFHAADPWPGQSGTLLVDSDGGCVTNSVPLTAAAPEYSPDRRSLVASSVVHPTDGRLPPGEQEVRRALATLYKQDTHGWELVAVRAVPQALPAMPAPHRFRRSVRVQPDGESGGPAVYVAGDHRDTSSIQGALVSGRRAAEAVRYDLAGL